MLEITESVQEGQPFAHRETLSIGDGSDVGKRTNTDQQPAANEAVLIDRRFEPGRGGSLAVLVLGEQTQLVAFGEVLNTRRCADQLMEVE